MGIDSGLQIGAGDTTIAITHRPCAEAGAGIIAAMLSRPSMSPHRWTASVAPMMDWTDRHCRFFHRLLSLHTLLYTEMVTTGALIHGDVPRHLRFNVEEHPVALQIGGSEPADLARCARLGESWGYDEINLNCGCPSERVQRGAFGACLMAEPALVADCVKAMVDVVSVPVTVKHRIGIDKSEDYGLRVCTRFRGAGQRGRMSGLHRACAKCLAQRAVAQGEPGGAATAL